MTPSVRDKRLRQPPLQGRENVRVFRLGIDDDIAVYATPSTKVFVEARWHGDYQQVPLDPDEIPALIDALNKARLIANGNDVLYVNDDGTVYDPELEGIPHIEDGEPA